MGDQLGHPPGVEPLALVVERLLGPECDLSQLNLAGLRVLLRVDLNVPVECSAASGHTVVSDATRINAVLPTVRLLVGMGAKVRRQDCDGPPPPTTLGAPHLVLPMQATPLGTRFLGPYEKMCKLLTWMNY